jgi:hypothetical protein
LFSTQEIEMRQTIEAGIFKPKPTQTETKSDATTKAARAILDQEAATRVAKTERLRAARLARQVPESPPKSPARKPAVKKPATEKAATKKPSAKKAVAKKRSAK